MPQWFSDQAVKSRFPVAECLSEAWNRGHAVYGHADLS